MAALVALAVLVALDAASALGATTDSRDASYGVGRLISYRSSARTKNR